MDEFSVRMRKFSPAELESVRKQFNITPMKESDYTKLPGGDDGRGHRMTQRWDDALFQPTQWFPRLCKYDDLHGWVTSPYLGPSEFYNKSSTI